MAMLLQPPAVRICGLEMCPSSAPNLVVAKFRGLRFWHRWVAFRRANGILRAAFYDERARQHGMRIPAQEPTRTVVKTVMREGITPYECSTEYRPCARRVG